MSIEELTSGAVFAVALRDSLVVERPAGCGFDPWVGLFINMLSTVSMGARDSRIA